jgi:hypothetical protein
MADPTPRTGIAAIARDAAKSRARIGEVERFTGTQTAQTTMTARTALSDAGEAQVQALEANDQAVEAQADAQEAAGVAQYATEAAVVADERAQAAARAAEAVAAQQAAIDARVVQAREAADSAAAAAAQVRTDAADALNDVEAALVLADDDLALAAKDAYDKAEAARIAAGESTTAANAANQAAGKASTAALAAQTTADNAVTASAFNINPHLDDWTGNYPVGWREWNGVLVRETALSRSKPYSARFSAAVNANIGIQSDNLLNALPLDLEYVVIELDVMMVSGTTFSGAGILIDWQGRAVPNRGFIKLGEEIPSPQLNKWYRVVKTLRRPSGTGTVTGWSTWLMANWGELTTPTMAAKEIIFDRIVYRPATSEEIRAIQAESAAAAAKSVADAAQKAATDAQSTATTAQTAANGKNKNIYSETAPFYNGTTAGDMWWVRLQNTGLILGQYEWTAAGAWERRTIGDSVIANLDAGKITSGYIAAARIAANTIIAEMMASDAILARHIKAGEVIAGKLGVDSVVAGNVATDAITAREILAGSVTAIELSADAINGKIITGVTIIGGVIQGATIRTRPIGEKRVELNERYISFWPDNSNQGNVLPATIEAVGDSGGSQTDPIIYMRAGRQGTDAFSDGQGYVDMGGEHTVYRPPATAGGPSYPITYVNLNTQKAYLGKTYTDALIDSSAQGKTSNSAADGLNVLPHIARMDIVPGQTSAPQGGATVIVNPPAGTRFIRKVKYSAGTTNGSGVAPRDLFTTAFPNACLYVSVTTITGSAYNPVINGGDMSKTGFTLYFQSTPNQPVTYVYEAVGW